MRFLSGACSVLFCGVLLFAFMSVAPLAVGDRVYQVVFLPDVEISLDGKADEEVWRQAKVERHFLFASDDALPPDTEFRGLCSRDSLYFTFSVEDSDVFILQELRDEEDQVFEDRIEMYFALDDQLAEYYCFEVDPKGRIFDYSASYYRNFDAGWNWKGLEASGRMTPEGYTVEGRIPLSSLEALGFPLLRPGAKIRAGLYRAEFSHDRSGKPVSQEATIHNLGRKLEVPPPIEAWITWIDPGVPEADFHLPSYFGWLEIVEAAK